MGKTGIEPVSLYAKTDANQAQNGCKNLQQLGWISLAKITRSLLREISTTVLVLGLWWVSKLKSLTPALKEPEHCCKLPAVRP